MHHEASRLVATDLISDRRHGNLRLIRSVGDSLLTRPLTDLLAVTYGPLPVLSDALAGLTNIEEAYIYGSWAARYQREPGAIPVDIDVLVVGSVDPDDLEEAVENAQQRLRRPVTIRRVRPKIWHNPDPSDPFLTSVRSRPLVRLHL